MIIKSLADAVNITQRGRASAWILTIPDILNPPQRSTISLPCCSWIVAARKYGAAFDNTLYILLQIITSHLVPYAVMQQDVFSLEESYILAWIGGRRFPFVGQLRLKTVEFQRQWPMMSYNLQHFNKLLMQKAAIPLTGRKQMINLTVFILSYAIWFWVIENWGITCFFKSSLSPFLYNQSPLLSSTNPNQWKQVHWCSAVATIEALTS